MPIGALRLTLAVSPSPLFASLGAFVPNCAAHPRGAFLFPLAPSTEVVALRGPGNRPAPAISPLLCSGFALWLLVLIFEFCWLSLISSTCYCKERSDGVGAQEQMVSELDGGGAERAMLQIRSPPAPAGSIPCIAD